VTRIRKKIKGRQERRRKDNKDKENKDDKGDKDKQNKDQNPMKTGSQNQLLVEFLKSV
jgi:hypothetical protein